MKLTSIFALGLFLLGGCLDSRAAMLGTNGVYTIINPPASVTLAWDSVAGTGMGYRLYQGTSSRTYTNMVDIAGATNINVTIQRGITYYFAVTAYNSVGLESQFSAEVSYVDTNSLPPVPSLKPPVQLVAQQKIGGGAWHSVYALSVDPSVAPVSSFRLVAVYSPPPVSFSPDFKPRKLAPLPLPGPLTR